MPLRLYHISFTIGCPRKILQRGSARAASANAVAISRERFDQQNIGLAFSNQFAAFIEAVCRAAQMISLVASDDCSHSFLTDTRVPHHQDPAKRNQCASCRAFFHGYVGFNKLVRSNAMLGLRFYVKILIRLRPIGRILRQHRRGRALRI